MIYDAFPFFNELELLDIRLHELAHVVDKFVLVEAPITHSGFPKPLYYDEHKQDFAEFSNQIIHIIVDDMPMTKDELNLSLSSQDRHWIATGYQQEDSWVRERFQRNAMMRILYKCDPNDIIIIEDGDEITRASVVERLEETMCDGLNAVEQSLNTYYLNMVCTNMPWWGTKILRKKHITTPSEDRFHTTGCKFIEKGGWHFTWLGGPDKIRQKIKSYAHVEFAIPDVLDRVEERLAAKVDVLGRLYQYAVVPMNDLPKYVLENPDKFDHLIYKGE